MKKFILLIVTLIGLTAWQSCQYEWVDPVDVVVPNVVSFAVDIQPIFDQGCNNAGCHSTGGTAPDLTPTNAYADLFAEDLINLVTPESSTLYTKIATGGNMNKYSQPGDSEIILKWIQDGALNN
jgi:hypothetical protein